MESSSIFICPICRTPLEKEGKSYHCCGEKRHCYDIASDGYVNLLPPGKKSNSKTGDDKEMLRCRQSFLSLGHYDNISRGIAAEACNALGHRDSLVFVDAGCGEGHHTLNILNYFTSQNIHALAVGLDASKHGAAYGAKKSRREGLNAHFAAANIFDIPMQDNSADIIFSMFAPVADSEAARILKDDGILCVCSSGTHHLFEMRSIIYDTPRLSPPLDRTPEGFEKLSHSSLKYTFTLEKKEDIAALFTMTPFYYRCPSEGRERLMATDRLSITCEVEYNIYKKANTL